MRNPSLLRDLSDFLQASFPVNKIALSQRKLILGVARNDANYLVAPRMGGVKMKCPAYESWMSLVSRAYCEAMFATRPTYEKVTVCNEWLTFSNFRVWWRQNVVDGWSLDKDLLIPGNTEYSPNACIFLPAWVNGIALDSKGKRGVLPVGVARSGKHGFKASCSLGGGKSVYVGSFKDPESAHLAWKDAKFRYVASRKEELDAIDRRLYENIVSLIAKTE